MTNKIIYPSILLLIVAAILIAPITHAQSSCPYIVSFNVTPTSGPVYITVAITGYQKATRLTYTGGALSHIRGGSWSDITDTLMTWNGTSYVATIGPFQPDTWVAWVFHDATTNTWINYQCVPFWN